MNIVHLPANDIVRYRRNPESRRVLDLGCGDGDRAIALAGHRFNHVTGLDSAWSLVQLAIQRAARRKVQVDFVCSDPCATPFDSGSFDEVMSLGDLFGHYTTAQADANLLREAHRLLAPGGWFHLRFADGDWVRHNYRCEVIEALPTGYIYRYFTLSSDGHHLRTEILSSDEGSGISRHETRHQWLYSPGEATDLLRRFGFSVTSCDAENKAGRSGDHAFSMPCHILHCRAED